MRKTCFCLILLPSALFFGCQSRAGLPYVLPDLDIPCAWGHPHTEGIHEGCPDCFCWWEALHDPALNSLITRASEQSPDLYIAHLQVMEARLKHRDMEEPQDNLSAVWSSLSAEVASNYVQLRGLQYRLELIDKNMAAQEDTYKLTRDLLKIGMASTIDSVQAQEQLQLLAAQKPLIMLSLDKAFHRISVLLGYSPDALKNELCEPARLPQLPMDMPIGNPEELLCRRPDIRKAEHNLALASANSGCSSGSLIAQEAQYEYQKTVLKALEEVENAIASYHYEQERNKQLEQAYRNNQEAFRLTFQLYKKGNKNFREVQEINRSLLNAEDAYVESQVQLLLHYISLYQALVASCSTP